MHDTEIGDYIESGYEGHDVYMPTEEYGRALDALVFACVDIFVTYRSKVLMVKRTRHPQADWWIVGGRMLTGEAIQESAQRLARIEMGLDVEAERFKYLTTFVAAWSVRAHKPFNNGSHNVSITMHVDLTPEEFNKIILNNEYDRKKLIDINELIGDPIYHPALRQCAGAYLRRCS